MPIWGFLQKYGSVLMQGTLVTCGQFMLAVLVAVSVALVT